MLTNAAYGKRVREREAFNTSAARLLLGRDKQPHRMNILRKAGRGIGLFADITKLMSIEKRTFIRQRLRHATREALQREFIGCNPFHIIRKRLLG